MTSDNPVQTKRCAECGEEKLDTAYPKRSGRQSRRAVCSRCMRRRKAANRRERAQEEPEASALAELPVALGENGTDVRQPASPIQEEPASRRKRKRRRKRSKRKGAAAQAAMDTQQEQGEQQQGSDARQEQGGAVRADSTNDGSEAGARADAVTIGAGAKSPVFAKQAEEDSPSRRKKRRKRKRRKRCGDPLPEAAAHADESGEVIPSEEGADAGDDQEKTKPGSKRRRKRRRRRSAASKPLRQPGESVYPDTPSVRPPDRVLKRFTGRYTTDPSILDDRGTGMILLRGWHTNGKRWQTEVTTEVASRMVLEGAAGVMHPRLIHKLYSKSDMRLLILQRDNYICKYCGGFGDTIDHVMPKSKGGLTSPANCVCACSACNLQKADKLLGETDEPDLTVHIPGDD